jgi:hypothetical protein
MTWRIRGSYFESCNCDAICPCRRIDGAPGGRSTHGICTGVLSWLVEEGAADAVDLSGLPVALAGLYSDDEPGSPWTWILYERAGEELVADELLVEDNELAFAYRGVCGYGSTLDYAGP